MKLALASAPVNMWLLKLYVKFPDGNTGGIPIIEVSSVVVVVYKGTTAVAAPEELVTTAVLNSVPLIISVSVRDEAVACITHKNVP